MPIHSRADRWRAALRGLACALGVLAATACESGSVSIASTEQEKDPVQVEAKAWPVDGRVPKESIVGGVSLELFLPPRDRLLGEPLLILGALRNVGDARTTVRPLLLADSQFATFRAFPVDGGEPRVFAPRTTRNLRGRRPVELSPGAAQFEVLDLTVSRESSFLDRPGRYRLVAEVDLGKGSLISAPLALELRAPADEAEGRAAALFTSGPVLDLICLGAPERAKVLEPLREYARAGEVLRFRALAAYYVGLALAIGDDPDRAALREQFARAATDLADPILTLRANELCARLAIDPERARALREVPSGTSQVLREARDAIVAGLPLAK